MDINSPGSVNRASGGGRNENRQKTVVGGTNTKYIVSWKNTSLSPECIWFTHVTVLQITSLYSIYIFANVALGIGVLYISSIAKTLCDIVLRVPYLKPHSSLCTSYSIWSTLQGSVLISTQSGKRKAREGVENAKRKHPRTSNGGLGRAENGCPKKRDTESVTLFEVVTMGRAAIQVRKSSI